LMEWRNVLDLESCKWNKSEQDYGGKYGG
jgi:hypothetical protein